MFDKKLYRYEDGLFHASMFWLLILGVFIAFGCSSTKQAPIDKDCKIDKEDMVEIRQLENRRDITEEEKMDRYEEIICD